MTFARWLLVLVAFTLSTALPAAAQKPASSTTSVTIVVPYAAGGATDTLARILAERLGPRLGVPVVVDNRGGAGGVIGAQTVARAKPDGQTLLMHSSAILPVAANLKDLNFDPMKALEPVAFVAGLPAVLVVHPSVPANNIAEFMAYLRANPGKLNCGILGEGGGDDQACTAIEKAAGGKMEHLTYRGLPPLDLDLLAGVIQVNVGSAAVQMPLVREGKLRVLATAMAHRVPDMPEVPTLIEAGVPYDALASNAIFAPAGTPPETVARLNKEIAAVLAEPEVRARIEALGFLLGPSDVESLRALFQRDWDRVQASLKH
ncbi:Tripartite-type tricarboxylate transporter, receptor component TctC [Enhydrobacter aerosaccus]|uniref:Tripartite-type tricarboxylate transporter, receptor component TctC n=1 Tax=Enhydrobacter aerosaccus TaxID=225324 RepID=A0A1T4QB42_9HYPH|nr:tripartite tricarboxylate transporter substrate binding protein [Enhydrobacter aerosaccus]SKA00761.1 Tripartite-type tricarboxylate transporter, receptor component TctC [Enhydrobacter aerosaccus]